MDELTRIYNSNEFLTIEKINKFKDILASNPELKTIDSSKMLSVLLLRYRNDLKT